MNLAAHLLGRMKRGARKATLLNEPGWRSSSGYRFSPALIALEGAGRSESISPLATDLINHHVAVGRRGLAICGASAGAGVSFVAANLAVKLAQAGVSTLLVDANFHQAAIHELIAPPGPRPLGLADLLGEPNMELSEVVNPDVVPGLAVVYAGAVSAASGSELLVTERFRSFTSECLRQFDCTIFDTPPANRSTDARAVAAAAGYALLVARKASTYVGDLALLSAQLEQDGALVIGSVLNAA